MPNYDNMFAGSNEDAEDFDDYNVLQRDLKVDGGLRPVREEDVIAIRNKAARALQAVFAGMGLPPITDEEVEAATYAHGSKDMPERNIVEDIKFAQEIISKNRNGLEVVKATAQGRVYRCCSGHAQHPESQVNRRLSAYLRHYRRRRTSAFRCE